MITQSEEKLKRLAPHIQKLVNFFHNKGVEYVEKNGNLRNVVFFTDEKTVKIYHDIFYRFSGICCTHRDTDKAHEIEVIPLTDENFYGVYIKAILMEHFFPKPKTVANVKK